MALSINQLVSELLSSIRGTGESMEASQLRAVITAALQRMDLVTREEFDAQTAVLQRTRIQLQQLQDKLEALENTIL